MISTHEIILSNSDNEGKNLLFYTESLPDGINYEDLESQILFLSINNNFISDVNDYSSEISAIQAQKSHFFLNPYKDIALGKKGENKALYNAPELSQRFNNDIVTAFTEKILEVLDFPILISDTCLVSYLGRQSGYHCFCFIQIDSSDASKAIDVIKSFNPYEVNADYEIKLSGFRKAYRDDEVGFIHCSLGFDSDDKTREILSNSVIEEITNELQLKIKDLIAKGFEPLVYRCIRQAIAESNLSISAKELTDITPAPIHISPDLQTISIPDYQIKEINLKPLHKAVYLLYLKYSDGILNRDEHEVELLKLYAKVGGTRADSVNNFCDHSKPSFYEVLSRIKSTFIELMDERIASNYFISGHGKGVKKIGLPNELIVWEDHFIEDRNGVKILIDNNAIESI